MRFRVKTSCIHSFVCPSRQKYIFTHTYHSRKCVNMQRGFYKRLERSTERNLEGWNLKELIWVSERHLEWWMGQWSTDRQRPQWAKEWHWTRKGLCRGQTAEVPNHNTRTTMTQNICPVIAPRTQTKSMWIYRDSMWNTPLAPDTEY